MSWQCQRGCSSTDNLKIEQIHFGKYTLQGKKTTSQGSKAGDQTFSHRQDMDSRYIAGRHMFQLDCFPVST